MSLLFKSWVENRQSDSKKVRIASIAVFNKNGEILIGKRRDNNKETQPGGHLEDGETPEQGAIRELKEETGLETDKLVYLGSGEVPEKNIKVYSFKLVINDDTSTKEDPDQEVFKWRWINPSSDEFKEVLNNLHSPKNITLNLLGLQRLELSKSEILLKSPVSSSPDDTFGDYVASPANARLHPKYNATHKLDNGMWIHEFEDPHPFKNRGTVLKTTKYYLSTSQVPDYKNIVGAIDGAKVARPTGNEFKVYASGIKTPFRGKGLGKKMYEFLLAQHGKITSDRSLSPQAQKVYSSLAKNPKYKVKFGDPTEETRHEITLKSLNNWDIYEDFGFENLDKALKHRFLTLAATTALNVLHPAPTTHFDAQPKQEQNQSVDTTQTAPPPMSVNRPWHSNGLAQDLHPIAYLESSYGKNMVHAQSKKGGEFGTAWGAVGFKPETAYEEYHRAPHLKNLYPGLEDKNEFINQFKTNHTFYNMIASQHWNRLKSTFGTPEKAAYAWRWGAGAAINSTPEQIKADPYVQAYSKLNHKLNPEMKKSEFDIVSLEWIKNRIVSNDDKTKVFTFTEKDDKVG